MFLNFFSKNIQPKTDFSTFFYEASSRQKKKLLSDVVRKANDDQKKLIEKYDEEVRSGAIKSA